MTTIFTNTLKKVNALLKVDSNNEHDLSKNLQWQILVQCNEHPWKFIVGKGGINTIFYTHSSEARKVVYPADIKKIMKQLAKRKDYCYEAYTKDNTALGTYLFLEDAKAVKHAKKIIIIHLDGTKTQIKLKKDIYKNKEWRTEKLI